MANQAPLFFDNSIFDIYGTMKCGGKLVFIPEALLTYQSRIPQFLEQQQVASIFWVPTIFKNIASSDGLIQFLGRQDSQIKFRGNRIELGEIEKAAMCVAEIRNACAVFDQERDRIVLFIETEHKWDLRKFNLELRNFVPKYMLPGHLQVYEKLPYTGNGKIDRVDLKQTLA